MPRSHLNSINTPITAAVTLSVALTIFASPSTLADHPNEAWVMSQEVRISATEFSFTPTVIKVHVGQPIHLVLDNSRAETEHVITIPALDKRIQAASGAEASSMIVFDKTGEYPFVCDLPGHTESGMSGKFLVVLPPS